MKPRSPRRSDVSRDNQPGMVATYVAPTVLLLLCAALVLTAATRAFAAWDYFAATQALDGSPESTGSALNRLDQALEHWPGRPEYHDLRGVLRARQAELPGVVGQERNEWMESAAQDHRDALATRPLWPYSWASLLGAKDALGQVDEEFRLALNRSAETGPWEAQAQRQVLLSGARNWDRLRTTERERLIETAEKAMRVQPQQAFGVARRFGRPELACGPETGRKRIDEWCASLSIQGGNTDAQSRRG